MRKRRLCSTVEEEKLKGSDVSLKGGGGEDNWVEEGWGLVRV